jgi:hypothetical protein
MIETLKRTGRLTLDYREAASTALFDNLSGIAADGRWLWTVSDDGRTLEQLVRAGAGYALHAQIRLDELLGRLGLVIPGKADAQLDLEALDFADGRLWLCGSHGSKRNDKGEVRNRPSRNLLAALDIDSGGDIAAVRCLPFEGEGSLREVVGGDPRLAASMQLPSKKNGFDIEGCAVLGDRLLLGLRGPLDDDGNATVVRIGADMRIAGYELSRLDLGGLGVRDLARVPDGLLILAGPVGEEPEPFRLHHWTGGAGQKVQQPRLLAAFPRSEEKPEGIAVLADAGAPGLVVIYDSSDRDRISDTRYAADRFDLGPLLAAGR